MGSLFGSGINHCGLVGAKVGWAPRPLHSQWLCVYDLFSLLLSPSLSFSLSLSLSSSSSPRSPSLPLLSLLLLLPLPSCPSPFLRLRSPSLLLLRLPFHAHRSKGFTGGAVGGGRREEEWWTPDEAANEIDVVLPSSNATVLFSIGAMSVEPRGAGTLRPARPHTLALPGRIVTNIFSGDAP